jgi:Kef-type K+ transport system membrane component KefB
VLADAAHGHAVLPAFVLGLVMARHCQRHRAEQERLRVVAFAFLTPLFFLRGGLNVSLAAVVANAGVLGVLAAAKMIPKLGLVLPLARRHVPEHATFATLLMSTGLTFGTIASLYGLNAGIINRAQFSLLVSVVVLSAIVPTAIAQRCFSPDPRIEAERSQPGYAAGPRPAAELSTRPW